MVSALGIDNYNETDTGSIPMAIKILNNWDYKMDKNSIGGSILAVWEYSIASFLM